MKQIFLLLYFPLIVLCFAACAEAGNGNIATRETEDHKPIKEPPSAIYLSDTANLFRQVKVRDTLLEAEIKDEVRTFYRNRNYEAKWFHSHGPKNIFDTYLNYLEHLDNLGLDQEIYFFYRRDTPFDGTTASKIDIDATASFFLLARHLSSGRLYDLSRGDTIWRKNSDNIALSKILSQIENAEELTNFLEEVQPKYDVYSRLLSLLQEDDSLAPSQLNDFDVVHPEKFRIGYTGQQVKPMAENLAAWGFLNRDSVKTTVTPAILDALRTFQEDKGIKVDGLPGRQTLQYLNTDQAELKNLLVLNAERVRWLPSLGNDEFITVNIPGFRLRLMDNHREKFSMKVVVGDEYKPTPIFADTLQYLVFRPTWTVPQSIIHEEMIPRLKSNPNYYTAKNFKIYEDGREIDPTTVVWTASEIGDRYFRFVQQPGNYNALGKVKFIMPNSMHIYLHDTPADQLFERTDRALSHGCIRVEDPAKLATYLLDNEEEWPLEKVREAMNSGTTRRVDLPKKIPVQLLYLTVWPDHSGKLRLLPDIYGHDKRQLEMLSDL